MTPIILAIVVAADLGLFIVLIVQLVRGMEAAKADHINQLELEYLFRRMHEHENKP